MVDTPSRPPARPILVIGIVIVAIAALSLLFVPLGGDGAPEASPTRVGGHVLLDEPAPEIDLHTIDGEAVALSQLRGRPVLINFWATWCPPCREEFPLMVAAYAEHADASLEILGVMNKDFAEGARAFAEDMGATWPILDDPDEVAYRDYLVPGLPTSFFVDPEGIVRAFSLGGFTETGLEAQLQAILPASSAPD